MSKTQNQQKLLKILNEIFQLNQSDLDFGIYRIMNTKSKEINEFLDKELISSVATAFSSNSAIAKKLNELIKTLTNAGMNADDSPKVQELKDSLSTTTTSSLEDFEEAYHKAGGDALLVEKKHFFENETYNESVIEGIKKSVGSDDYRDFDLIFSAHGLPQKIVDAGEFTRNMFKSI